MNPTPPPRPDRKLRILLCGYGHLGLALLRGLWERGADCEIVGVFRWSSRPGGKGYWEPIEETFQQEVRQFGLREIQCKGLNAYEFTVILQDLKPDVLLVGSWGEIIKPHLIDLPGLLLINCHPSKLPAHRGANPYSSVILQNESETGVTFHRVAPTIDSGAIILQRAVPLEDTESGATVRDKCASVAYEMVAELLGRLRGYILDAEPLGEIEQDHSLKSYYPQLKPKDGELDWNWGVDAMCRHMRALFPWIACSSYLEGKHHMMFYDPQFVPRQNLNETLPPPGTILAFESGKIRVALADFERELLVSAYQFASGQRFWPMWLTRLLAPFLLRPGKRFMDAL